ncbi:GH1 family beta-glucosidase [Endozoicomonas elysicola]|uniref:Beta-glucosidase n=1 Tax=Endozoicomonas elysicola TaxID=305900 RepID=A0A081KEN4_9GAMM|nr:GH1 family beta-glucosidase [Endozoicomonas elysicola]KEI72610.1 beta-galactosidase [Endozoicomonas elysicola]
MDHLNIPRDFLIGAATAAYQIEGAVREDGRGPSIWDTFCHQPGNIDRGHNADTACDHYHRYQEDVGIMDQLSLDAYRFSISWSRIFPEGKGRINPKGLAFYDRLIDSLLEAGITPFTTLFHWDTPEALYQQYGGFAGRETCYHFADYTKTVVNHFGDRVKHWITVNEPWEHATFGHLFGHHAPGKRNPWTFWRAMHHILLGHGMAMQAIRSEDSTAKAGLTLSYTPMHIKGSRAIDLEAAKTANAFMNGIAFDPIFKGHYPEVLWQRFRWFRPPVNPGDFDIIQTPTDFTGLNYYSREFVRGNRLVPGLRGTFVARRPEPDPYRYTAMDWEIYPEGFNELLTLMRAEYGNPPVYITENGAAYFDKVDHGIVSDQPRISYLRSHIHEVLKARQEGTDVRGYFAWSLLDNFEWAKGFSTRFGLVHVDYESGKRTIKNSGYWLQQQIRQRGALEVPAGLMTLERA